jgi:hypothetical protein
MSLMKRWALAFIGLDLDDLPVYRSLPQEDTQFIVPRVHLKAHIELMRTHSAGKFVELIFNLDQVDSWDWEDCKPRTVIASRAVSVHDRYYPVSRCYRHVTLLACVSAACDSLTLMIVSQSSIRESV